MKAASLMAVLAGLAASAAEIRFEEGSGAVFGGIGFQNAEAEIAVLMPDDFRDQRALKSFLEISPTFARVYAGFADCPREQTDRFADWYDLTFRRAGTELYAVGGMMPFVAEDETEAYAEKVAANLEYLVKVRGCANIRHYCMTNELGIDGRGDWYFNRMERFRQIHAALRAAFDRHGLQGIGLAATDVNQHVKLSLRQLDWATRNMDDITSIYCTHWYMFMGRKADGTSVLPSSPENAATMRTHFSSLVAKAAEKGKRYFIGEFGLWTPPTHGENHVMHDDTGYPLRSPEHAGEGAMTLAEIALTAMNEGAYAAASWSFVDYPDPFVFEPGDTPGEDAVYQAAKCVYWPDRKYNKWGLFRWDSVDRNYRAYPSLYTMGHLARLFRRGARVLKGCTDDASLRGGCVVNPDGSVSIALINWGGKKQVSVRCERPLTKPLRVYEYDSVRPPDNAFNDLQPASGTAEAKDGTVSVEMSAKSMLFLTTDYEDRVPAAVTGVNLQGGRLRWKASGDPEHRYYRVYRNGLQVASTVATSLPVAEGDAGTFAVRSVDRWGNEGGGGSFPEMGELFLLPQPTRVVRLRGDVTLNAQADIRWTCDKSLPKEGYRLKVSKSGVEAAFADDAGRVYALQTLRQLAGDRCRDALVLTCPATLPCCEIEDSPKFPWRGYMLDTSRHFFGTETIRRALDAMAYHKLNVFHWHLVDGNGWRFPVDAYPALTNACATRINGRRTASWGRDESEGKYGPFFHPREDIVELVRYAKERGIEIVPEIDIPGHQGINGTFRFACCQSGLQPEGTNRWAGMTGDMCVGNPEAYRFYEKVFDEICDVFPSKVIHIGGDEVGGKDWDRCPRCQKVMRERGLKGQRALQNVVMRHFAEYLAKKGRRAIGWDEILEGGEMPRQTMMTHFHSGGRAHLQALAAGHDVVMMPSGATYFDCEQDVEDDPYDIYQVFNGRQSWKVSYGYDPCARVPEKDCAHVLGLQGCSWTEILCNEKELDWSVYPRLSCLAEIGWSYPAKRDAAVFAPRLAAHRERLVGMGINAAPIGPLKPVVPAIEPKPESVRLSGFAVVFAPRLTEDVVTWMADPSVPAGGYVIEISAKPMQSSGKIEVRHSDAAGKVLALKVLAQIATPKNTGVFYIPKGTISGATPRAGTCDAASR